MRSDFSPNYKKHDKLGYSSICYIGSRIGWVSMKEYRYGSDGGKMSNTNTLRYILTGSAYGAVIHTISYIFDSMSKR